MPTVSIKIKIRNVVKSVKRFISKEKENASLTTK